ncbi:DUF397 domain-containing protein [Nocardiopsis sp. CNR-923]|uniref:DUF397 domain-containing protein n=1 Tax=Nocardiopsis sp. CNR-923 TaxID=1904965 RepID=UPI00095BB1A5|nr:DUF397 domain-containing protein [Nocardiopsis sp. CNR-923]OLT26648.1 DUF397 domain-containing protein [Nocardiopsis sp. CNR-923]
MSSREWRKSSYSSGVNNNCVEVSEGSAVLVRDTQNRGLGHLTYPRGEWTGLLAVLKTSSRID